MKDSILKGTGNSRFLKSAIPDGTTWAEALAMLRAGTFPMDLNGINNAGFQQVGTPLNKANLLKDVNALTLGLTGDAVPDDMFNVLAHAGDLHVWKKTVGSTVTYPVSTNRNAYQEGSDAKPAGYTLGDVETGKFALGRGTYGDNLYSVNTSGVEVNDDGTIKLPSSLSLNGASSTTMIGNAKVVIGSVIRHDSSDIYGYCDFDLGKTYFIPSDATTGSEGSTGNDITNYVTKRQPVTGYAATPANTTIEYLGCLGEKTRVQVVSYVGTRTYGESNPCSLTFDFPPKVVFYLGYLSGTSFYDPNYNNDTQTEVLLNMPTVYTSGRGFTKRNGTRYGKISLDGKTLYWYSTNYSDQLNNTGYTYYYLAIG